jgi:hypothetical protein
MNPVLSKLLHSNQQLIRPQEGFGAIDMAEWTMLLDMDDERYPSVGDWVTVRCGLYKGDVGYVQSVENWGEVSLLLVPRLPPPPMVDSSSRKRKRSGTRTDPRLFTKEMQVGIAKNHDITRIYESTKGLMARGLCSVASSSMVSKLEHSIVIQYRLPLSPCLVLHSTSFKRPPIQAS